MKTPIIESERLILRPLKIKDADTIFSRWTTDTRVTKFMSYNTHQSVEDTKEWLKSDIAANNGDKTYVWAFELKENNYLFGSGGLYFSESQNMFELGYNIMYDFWNKGYTTEAASAIIDFAKRQLGVSSLYARHAVDNPASGKVMEKNGFVFTGYGTITSYDGKRKYKAKEYILKFR